MNPLRVWATNYRAFDRLDLHLPTGTCAIVGPNGAGKSSIVNVIDLALFGPESRSLADYLTDDAEGDLELGLEFEHAGTLYRVRRGFSAKGRGKTTLDFETYPVLDVDGEVEGGGWLPLTRETAKETQALIEQTIGLSRKTWRASAFLGQGDGASFTEADPRERKSILAEILSLGVWDTLLDRARSEHRTADTEIARLNGQTQLLQETADRREEVTATVHGCQLRVDQAGIALAKAEAELAKAAAKVREAETQADRRRAAEAELAQAQTEHDRLRALSDAAVHATADKRTAREELDTLATVDQLVALERQEADLQAQGAEAERQIAEHEALGREYALKHAQRAAILAQANDLNEKAHAIREEAALLEENGPGATVCDRCQQTLGAEALVSALASMRTDADDLDAAAKDLDAQAAAIALPVIRAEPIRDAQLTAALETARARLREARQQQEHRARLVERISALDEKIAAAEGTGALLLAAAAAVERAEVALAACQTTLDLDVLQESARLIDRDVQAKRAQLDNAKIDRARAEAELERIADVQAQLEQAAVRVADLQAEVDLLADLERAYGRDGIPALIVESQAIPQIEVEANRILSELGTLYRVELRTQRALKSGDGLRDTLDVVVIAEGGARAYETFSGGERTRINLALRIALARLLAHRRGAESRLLCIDEPDGLDADGFARLAEILRGLSGDFERVYVISHHPDLRDAFDVSLEVVKVEGRSRVVELAGLRGLLPTEATTT